MELIQSIEGKLDEPAFLTQKCTRMKNLLMNSYDDFLTVLVTQDGEFMMRSQYGLGS